MNFSFDARECRTLCSEVYVLHSFTLKEADRTALTECDPDAAISDNYGDPYLI